MRVHHEQNLLWVLILLLVNLPYFLLKFGIKKKK